MDRTNAPQSVGGMFVPEAGAVLATVLEPAYMNMIQEELYYLITQAGLTPDRTNTTQIREAINAMLAGSVDSYICQGRLGLESGVPVSTTDQMGKTTLYFAPYNGKLIGIFNGTNTVVYSFTELSIAIPASVNTNYDIFIYDNSGTLTLEAVAWANDSVRATALVLQNNVPVKSGSTNKRYLGTIRTTSVSGECESSYGKRFVSNYYNKIRMGMEKRNLYSVYTYSTDTFRVVAGDTTQVIEFVQGVVENIVDISATGYFYRLTSTDTEIQAFVGIGINSATVNSANINNGGRVGDGSYYNETLSIEAKYNGVPDLGYNKVYHLERAVGDVRFTGTASTQYFTGILGDIYV